MFKARPLEMQNINIHGVETITKVLSTEWIYIKEDR